MWQLPKKSIRKAKLYKTALFITKHGVSAATLCNYSWKEKYLITILSVTLLSRFVNRPIVGPVLFLANQFISRKGFSLYNVCEAEKCHGRLIAYVTCFTIIVGKKSIWQMYYLLLYCRELRLCYTVRYTNIVGKKSI